MIYKCPNCNGALEYNPEKDKMQCFHCGNNYFMWELDENAVEYHENIPVQSEVDEEKFIDFTKERTIYDEPEFMECKVYTCSTCGAELTVNDTEVSTYCAYCGQPTIVYNRVDKTQKPKYIIPFKITREEAEAAIRNKLKKGFFIPRKIKKFEPEKVTGIYLPYFLYDVYYQARTHIKTGKKNYWKKGDCDFEQVCQDASKSVSDELTYLLEPYHLTELKDFEAGYLSGFYAERFDLSARQLTNTVGRRCRRMYEEELARRLEVTPEAIKDAEPYFEINKADYAFLPVWFMTFRYKDRPCTILVNGQTGKVAATLPFQNIKLLFILILLSLLFATPFVLFGCWCYQTVDYLEYAQGIWVFFSMWLFADGAAFFTPAIRRVKKIRKQLNTLYTNTESFVDERQEKN